MREEEECVQYSKNATREIAGISGECKVYPHSEGTCHFANSKEFVQEHNFGSGISFFQEGRQIRSAV
jgi:hypothetical protein